MTDGTNWGTSVLPKDKAAIVDGYESYAVPGEYQPGAQNELSALIFYLAVKEDADALVAALGGRDAFCAEARRYRQWLVRDDLPETLTLWQGGRGEPSSISWSTSRAVAETFAEYMANFETGDRYIITATVDRNQVVMAPCWHEQEEEVLWQEKEAAPPDFSRRRHPV